MAADRAVDGAAHRAVDRPMTIVEHLEELRRRLLVALAAFGVAAAFSFRFLVDPVLSFLLRPVTGAAGHVVFLAPAEAFLVRLRVALLCGVFLSLPVILYQLWRFVSIGLTPTERRYALWLLPPALLLFVAGGAFALTAVMPVAVRFLLQFQVPGVLEPMISIGAYTSFVTTFVLGFGLVFEIPILLVFLTKLGVVTPASLAARRPHAIVIIAIVAAILTPPDVVSQLMMAAPAYLLYEGSILVARLVTPSRAPVEQVEGR